MITLETPRLMLRKFRPDDLDRVVELTSNPGFMRFSSSPDGFTREQAIAFLERMLAAERAGKPSQFGVILRDEERLVGYCGFFMQEVDGVEEPEIGYRLHPDYWGHGFGSEAAQAVREHAFRDLRLERVISIIHPDNAPSKRVAEKNRMRIEKETTFRGFDVLIYALSRAEWQAQQAAQQPSGGA